MRGVTTQVSAPKSSINWTTALKKNTDTRSTVPPMLRILVNLRPTARAFVRFLNTAEKASPIADITCPKYLKEITISRGSKYAMNALEVTDLSSSADRRHIFCYTPLFHSAVHQCILFRSRHEPSMLHRGHCGWGRCPSSSITTVSQACWCQKFTRIDVHVDNRPLNPSTGQGLGPAFARNIILNILGFSPPSP